MGPAVILPSTQGMRRNLQQAQGLLYKFLENISFWNYFSTVKSMNRVHSAVDRRRGSSEHERWWRGDTTVMEGDGGKLHDA
jgi:hypothetical protein